MDSVAIFDELFKTDSEACANARDTETQAHGQSSPSAKFVIARWNALGIR
jgi:hypothetical protein